MDAEVFGMAGVPEGAVPGAPPPEEEEPTAQPLTAAPLPPAPLPPPGSQMPGTLAQGVLMQSPPHYMVLSMHPVNIQQPIPGAPPFVPAAFPGMLPHFMRPPPGMGPPPGFQVPGMPPQAASGSGPFQQQRPPLFPGGAGPPAQGHPVFPIGQAAGPAAIANISSKPAPQPQPLFPVGQCTASGAAFAQGHLPKALAGAQPELQPRTDLPAGEPAASSASLAPGLAGGPQLGAGPPLQAQPAGDVANLVHATPHPQHIMLSLIAGYGTANGSMHATPARRDAPALDESNPAVIWKAIDVSMEESRAQQPRYQQKLSKAARSA
ncbi:g6667 [Coccomyxa viridis]|uniref:G6667 protein n=1 Tax=Coccomyxa viridis TaxID=1274662 RepID=A0ABP1FYG6_9CHLO